MRLTVILPTVGRPGLTTALASLRHQLLPGDEVLCIGDGHQPGASAQWHASLCPGLYVECPGPCRDWGHTPRNWAVRQGLPSGDYLCFLDDDDVYTPGAVAAIRATALDQPDRVFLFRMLGLPQGNGPRPLIWREPAIRPCNVGTPMIVVPNVPARLGVWGSHPLGDHDFAASTVAKDARRNQPVFVDQVICHVRPDLHVPVDAAPLPT